MGLARVDLKGAPNTTKAQKPGQQWGAMSDQGTVYIRRAVLARRVAASLGTLAATAFGGAVPGAAARTSARAPRAADEFLPPSKLTIGNTLALNLTKHLATIPLLHGACSGQTAWGSTPPVIPQSLPRYRVANLMGLVVLRRGIRCIAPQRCS